jgi:hypothetical protein
MTDEIKLNVDQRTLVRAAITSHDGWKAYRREHGIDASNLGTAECLRACAVLGIDIYATLVAGARNTTTQQGDDMKERTVTAEAFRFAKDKFSTVTHQMTEAERDKGLSIISTVLLRQDGAATTAQYHYVRDTALRYANEANATTTTAAAVVTPPLEAAIVQSATATAADPAGAALAAMVLPHIVAGLNQSVTRLVEARLENVQTVRIEVARHDGTTGTTEGHTHPQLARLLRACSSRMASGYTPNAMLVGPTGTGKTHAAHQVARALGLEYYAHGAMSMSHELLGFTDAHGTTHRTPFRDAFERGGLVILDELDSWDAGVTLALNAALANGYAGFPDGMVARHRDCVIIGAGNTHGTGATADFVGRNRLDAAFLSRFPVKLQWDADPALEVAISGDAAFTRRVQAARERARAVGLKHLIDMRQMQAGAALIAAGFTSDEAADLTYLAGLSADQRRMIEGA